jgi:hypothetical protein
LSHVKDDALRSFLGELIDDAGLFPPAALSLADALAAHERAAASDAFWIVGGFVVPGSRVPELIAALDAAPGRFAVSAIVEPHEGSAAGALRTLASAAASPRLALEALECPLASIAGGTADERLERLLAAVDAAGFEPVPGLYVEIAPHSGHASEGLLALRRAREREPERDLYAKLRCGARAPAAVPSGAAVAGFIWEAARLGVPFKATAGLHHAVRHDDAAGAPAHGFLNVIGAAVLAHARGLDRATLEAIVLERDPGRFTLDGRRFAWNGIGADAEEIGAARQRFIHSYGSCSLEEPVDDLRALGMLPGALAR